MTAAVAASAGIAAAVVVALFLWLSDNLIKTSRYRLAFGGIEREVKIAQVSDLHGKNFGKDNLKLVGRIKAEAPDFIAVTGDLIHKYTPANVKTALNLVSTLSQIAPVLFVSGNHEMRNKGYRFFRKQLKEAGAEVLDDSTVEICGVTVTGLNGAHNKNGSVFKIAPPCKNKLLLAHMPQFFGDYAAAGFGVVLCGHAHGGQWRIPFTRRGIYAPGQGLFPKYTQGVYVEGNSRMVVSRGLGNSEFPFRLFNRPELTVVTLVPESNGQ